MVTVTTCERRETKDRNAPRLWLSPCYQRLLWLTRSAKHRQTKVLRFWKRLESEDARSKAYKRHRFLPSMVTWTGPSRGNLCRTTGSEGDLVGFEYLRKRVNNLQTKVQKVETQLLLHNKLSDCCTLLDFRYYIYNYIIYHSDPYSLWAQVYKTF